MSINEASPSPSPSPPDHTSPSLHKTSPPKSKCSLRSWADHLKAKLNISKHKAESESESIPKQFEKSNPNAASTSATTTANHYHGGVPALDKLIDQDLSFMKQYNDSLSTQINQGREKLLELRIRGSSSGTQLDELKKLKSAVAKLKSQIPSRLKIPSDSNQQRNSWPDINKSSNEVMQLYPRPDIEDSIEPEDLQGALDLLPYTIKRCLFCFLIFPPLSIINRRFLTYWWIGNGLVWWHGKQNNIRGKPIEHIGNEIFDMLIAEGFIKPIFQKRSLVPDSCKMTHSVHAALTVAAKVYLRTFYVIGQDNQRIRPDRYLHVINVGEAIIDYGPEVFEEMKNITIVYLGRWQSLATHHIEIEDTKILDGLKHMNRLEFLSLRGISLITELPSFISEFTRLKILDLKACHNLEVIPDGIGLLKQLTHLDMSECYFLEYMPKSLAYLTELEVLKGFLIQDSKYDYHSCTLDDLSGLQKLRKLNIYTSVEDFPTERHLSALQKFEALRKLTISWGGRSSLGENDARKQTKEDAMQSVATDSKHLGTTKQAKNKAVLTNQPSKPPAALPSTLQKLDLQCFHGTSPPIWLSPTNLNQLTKLYIRGGPLRDLGRSQELSDECKWAVEILYLKYLSELEMNWEELMKLFPKLVYVVHEECPKLTNFPDTAQVYLKPKVNKSK